MNRSRLRILLLTAFVTVPVATLWSQTPSATPPTTRPLNVLLVVSDDHRHDALGCAGNPVVKTPNIDRLAASGVRFTHAFAEVPICTPSRAAYLTGRHGASNGVTFFGMRLLDGTPTWAGTLKDHGYQTAFTGKWHNVRGFDEYGFDWSANVFQAGMGNYRNPKLIQRPGEKPTVIEGEITELITDAAVRFLDQPKTSPFFLYVAYTAPHDPREPPPEYEKMYDPQQMPLPKNFRPVPQPDPGTLGIRDEKLLSVPRDPADIRRETAKYYGLITYMDVQFGRILQALDKNGLADSTVVMFAGDNGLTLGSHGLLGKQTLHEEGIRIPLIMRHPRLKAAGEKRDALVDLCDMMPTALEWVGVPVPAGVQGASLADVYAGKAASVRDCVFNRYDERGVQMFRSIRTDRYKLIQYIQLDREQLFDLASDPYELKDLAEEPQLRDIRRDLHERLMKWRAEQDRIESGYSKPWDTTPTKGNPT